MGILERKIVLVVDDDRDIREAVTLALSDAGYLVLTASNGMAAIEVLRKTPGAISLVLLDLMMPVMDGWEFCLRQQDDPELSRVPVVIFSAGGKVEEKARNLAVAGWLRKPMRISSLLAEVERVIAKSRAHVEESRAA